MAANAQQLPHWMTFNFFFNYLILPLPTHLRKKILTCPWFLTGAKQALPR
jgi:hypothetical protein